MAIKGEIGVVGAGTMGSGIAQAVASSGRPVVLADAHREYVAKGLRAIERSLQRFEQKGNITADQRHRTLELIRPAEGLGDLIGCGLIVEAVTENLVQKTGVFRELDATCRPETIFASNTSSISITRLAAATGRADRFIGMHFMNPVPLMKLVEVVRTVTTEDSAMEEACAFAASIGKVPIRTRDRCGFIVNRLLVPYLIDAVRALEDGTGSIADIDNGMKLGCGYPMGPFTLLDFVGLDTTLYICDIMYAEFREPRYAPPPLLKRMVLAGYHGKKNGRGFYDWSGDPPRPNDYLVGGAR